MKGRVLDVGGKKIGKRGLFRPPTDGVESWEFLNTDESTQPDYSCGAESIPFKDNTIDTIIMCTLMEYLPNPKKVLRELYRVLASDGHVLMSIPFLNPIHGDHRADRARYSLVMLREMVEEIGFLVKEIEPMGSVGAVIYDILRVATGYADEEGKYRRWSKLLSKSRGFFSRIDKKTQPQMKYINTGYFIVLARQV